MEFPRTAIYFDEDEDEDEDAEDFHGMEAGEAWPLSDDYDGAGGVAMPFEEHA